MIDLGPEYGDHGARAAGRSGPRELVQREGRQWTRYVMEAVGSDPGWVGSVGRRFQPQQLGVERYIESIYAYGRQGTLSPVVVSYAGLPPKGEAQSSLPEEHRFWTDSVAAHANENGGAVWESFNQPVKWEDNQELIILLYWSGIIPSAPFYNYFRVQVREAVNA